MTNIIRNGKVVKERVLGGKGNWKEIQKETQKIAKIEKIDFNKLNGQKLYNFQKKHKIGIDCSGLVCQLLIFLCKIQHKKINLNIRRTSANMLTSSPLSQKINNYQQIQTGDLIRQKNGHHLLFIIEKKGNKIFYVDSSFWGRGVRYGETDLNNQSFDNQGIYRLFFFN
ncbi:MAG: hypothetical protein PHX34_05565 [Candidatus Shapirobacteria bacterium]|nr:hypothetical protein [Candidatus Shapirobacteria bacterium]